MHAQTIQPRAYEFNKKAILKDAACQSDGFEFYGIGEHHHLRDERIGQSVVKYACALCRGPCLVAQHGKQRLPIETQYSVAILGERQRDGVCRVTSYASNSMGP